VERRSQPRVHEAFPAQVRGVDDAGQGFELETVLDNLSTGGLYMRLPRSVRCGSKLSLVVRFPGLQNGTNFVPLISLKGTVTRAEPQADGRCGLAVVLSTSRLLSSEPPGSNATVAGDQGGVGQT
jgi:hypothetical protein